MNSRTPPRPTASAAARNQFEIAEQEQCRSNEQCTAHPDLDRAPREFRHDTCSPVCADNGCADHRDQRQRVDSDSGNEDQALQQRRQTLTSIERARDALISNYFQQFEQRRRRGKGSDAERIEEVRTEPVP